MDINYEFILFILLGTSCLALVFLSFFFFRKWQRSLIVISHKDAEIRKIETDFHRKDIHGSKELALSCSSQTTDVSGWFSSSYRVDYLMQLMYDGLPVGQPWVQRSDLVVVVNVEEIKNTIEHIIAPYLAIGMKAIAQFEHVPKTSLGKGK